MHHFYLHPGDYSPYFKSWRRPTLLLYKFFVSGVKRDRDLSSMNEKSVLYNEKEYHHCSFY